MLSEIKNARQVRGEGRRRWYRDDDMDLILWYAEDNELIGFQLCYGKQTRERCLTWRASRSEKGTYTHSAVDDGEVAGQSKMSPILVADGLFDRSRIEKLFLSKSSKLDTGLAHFIAAKLRAYDK